MEDVLSLGRWGVVWIRAAERGGGACNRNPGLESDKLGRVTEWQSRAEASGTLQDLRFGRRDGRGRESRDQLGSGKLGWTVNKLSELVRWAAAVVVVSWAWAWACRWSTVFRNSGTGAWGQRY